jgi:hypothetical protein
LLIAQELGEWQEPTTRIRFPLAAALRTMS